MLRFVRYGLPALLVVAGFVLLVVAPESTRYEGFSMCVGAGLALALLNVLFRISSEGDRERDREAAAREYMAEHGHWPDERPPRRSSGGHAGRGGARRRGPRAGDGRGLEAARGGGERGPRLAGQLADD